ncbi:MAG: hypothetical protein JW781_08745 [Deltaproteobacteria bacterium]|nr:hypothetical protein [Candidatus Anaeroferrophillacea bacterium]
MGIEYARNTATLSGLVGVEEAEGLLEWLQNHPKGRLDLAACTHLHTANLQVIMAAQAKIAAWPGDAELDAWLRAAVQSSRGE